MRHTTTTFLAALLLAAIGATAHGHTVKIGMAYDSAGRIEKLMHPNRTEEIYTYNGLDSQDTVKYGPENGAVDVVSSTSFSPSGLVTSRQVTSSVASPGGTELRGYDALGRLTSHRLEVGATVYDATKITYDERSYVESVLRDDDLLAGTSILYKYKVQGELESYRLEGVAPAAQADFVYDSQGNIISRSGLAFGTLSLGSYAGGPFDSGNRVNAPGWEYDDDGRLTADDAYLYSYNRAGRLALVTDRSGNLVAHYLYDAGGMRVRKMTDSSVTYFYRDPTGAVIGEQTRALDNQEQVLSQRDYVRHNGGNVMTAHQGEDAGFERQLTDRLGNPVVRWRLDDVTLQEYSPYGQQMHLNQASQHDGPYDYTGHERDAETDHMYMRARFYDPETARFSRPDPARDSRPHQPATFNLYQYALNNPVNVLDPTGLAGQGDEGSCSVLTDDTGLTRTQVRVRRGAPVGKFLSVKGGGVVERDNDDNAYIGAQVEGKVGLVLAESPVGVRISENNVSLEFDAGKIDSRVQQAKGPASGTGLSFLVDIQVLSARLQVKRGNDALNPNGSKTSADLTLTSKSSEISVRAQVNIGYGFRDKFEIPRHPQLQSDFIREPTKPDYSRSSTFY